MSSQDPKEIVIGFVHDVDAGRAGEAFARLAPDVRFELIAPPPQGGVYDRAALIKFFAETMAPAMAAPFRVKITGITSEGERVAVETESTCVNHKGFAYNNRYHTIYVVRDGLIVELREYLDSAHMREFLGV